ncbi:MAG: hypothetical protein L0154_11785 [Chloroflexi bacterium]|nr:hypothetical protein [Chloroflexota bacterium]
MWENNRENNDEWYMRKNEDVKPVRNNFLGNLDFNFRTCAIIGVIGAALLCIVPLLLFGGLVAWGGGDDDSGGDEDPTDFADIVDDDGVQINNIVSAEAVNDMGCAVDVNNSFADTAQIYIVAEDSDFPEGTDVFVRLYREGDAIEDAPEITADQDYENTCVNFLFVPESGETFDEGDYEAEFYVNGEATGSVAFVVE